MSPHRWLPVLLAGAAIASPASADPQTFDQALARASANAPGLQAAALRVEAARAALPAAGALPDPQLKLGIENVPISGPMAGRFGDDEMTMATVGLMQEVPNGARRRAEAGIARADIGSARAEVAVEVLDVRLGAALAWIDLHYAGRRLAALDGVLQTLEPLWDAAPAGVTAGATRPANALTPVAQRAALEDRRSELVAALGRARAELVRWTGDPSPNVTGPPPEPALDAERLRAGLDRRPALLAYASAARRAAAEVDLARAAKRPDWAFEVGYGRRDPMFGDMVSAGVTVRLPLFASRRQDPLIAARAADARRVEAERETARRALAASLEADLADQTMRREQWLRTRDVVLPAAKQQADLETASYAAGRAGLSEVLDAFTRLAEAQLAAIDREAALAREAVRIDITYGSDAQ